MATYDITTGSGIPEVGVGKAYVKQKSVNLGTAANGNPVAAADVIQVMDIPAQTLVLGVSIEVVTASTATALTLDAGDGADPNGFYAGADATAAAGTITVSVGGTDAYATTNGRLYTAADTIDLVIASLTGTADGVVKVSAMCFDLN